MGGKGDDNRPAYRRRGDCIAARDLGQRRCVRAKTWRHPENVQPRQPGERVGTNGDYEVTFHLKRPQPAFLMLLADGHSAIYPCHVPAREMRGHPIGTGPFKFVEFKPNERITVARNPDYWKPGRPYLDGIEYTIIPNASTRMLAFVAGKLDLIWASIPLLKDIKSQAPQASCDVVMDNNSRDLIVN